MAGVDPFAFDPYADPFAVPGLAPEMAQPPEWHGLDIPSAAPAMAPPMDIPLAQFDTPLLPAPGMAPGLAPAPVAPVAPPVEAASASPAPPMPTPTQAEVRDAIRVPEEGRPADIDVPATEAGYQAELIATSKAAEAERQADHMLRFAERIGEVNERDDLARKEVMANVERIDERLTSDQDEVRALTRQAAEGKLSSGAQVGMIVGGALQAIKALIGAGPANTAIIDQIVERDAQAKARALQMARERAGVSEDQRDTELGKLQERDYLRQVAITTTWEQVEADLRADAAQTQNVQAKLELETAAERAGAAAMASRNQAAKGAYMWELDAAKKQADIQLTGQKTRKTAAEAAREERRGMGGRKKDTPTMQSVEAQLQGLEPKDRDRVEGRGVRDSAGNFLMTPNKKFVVGNSKEEALKLRDQWGSLQSVNDSLNRLDALRGKYGMEWDITNSVALQDMKSTMAELELKLKDTYQLGVLSDSDLAMLQKITGGDPTDWFDKRPTWEAMRSRIEGGFNRELRAHSSYKGQFKLPKGKVVERKVKDIASTIDQPYNPRKGTMLPTATRIAALEEERMAIAREGGTAGGLGLATELAAERVIKRVNEDHLAILKRIDADREKAREAGDDAKVKRLTKARNDQLEFAAQADAWGSKQSRKRVEQEEAERKRAKRAEERHAGYEDVLF